MNPALYFVSYAATAVALALAAWAAPRALRLPGLTRILLGLAATPLLLPVLTLAITLAWPHAPRWILLAAPAILVAATATLRGRATVVVLQRVARRFARMRPRLPHVLTVTAGAVLLFTAAATMLGNARPPLSEHDALIYFNEARMFANAPAWATYLRMANPAEPAALVSGHTHTWLFPTYIAQALLATSAPVPGPGHDLIARCATQGILLLLLLAVGGLTFAMTRRSLWLSVVAMAGVASIRHVAYVTTATSIDAFRILPLVLAATVLVSGPRGRAGWIIAAAFLALSTAAHTLNLVFAAPLVVARLWAGVPAGQGREFSRTFLPAAAVFTLPVAAHYWHLWRETGRLLGHGMHYPFYADSPLQAAATAGVLRVDVPSLWGVVRELVVTHGWWCTIGPLLLIPFGFCVARNDRGFRFVSFNFVLLWLALVSGVFIGPLRSLTWSILDNFRYPVAVWVLGLPVMVASAAALLRRLPTENIPVHVGLRRFGTVVLSLLAVWIAREFIDRRWPIRYNTALYLDVGERWLAAETAQLLRPGETWLTDSNTVAYYSARPAIFLFTPSGHRWIRARTADEAWKLLCTHRVRLVAFRNRAENWWPRTALYAALTQPGHAERRDLVRWQVFHVNLPALNPTASR